MHRDQLSLIPQYLEACASAAGDEVADAIEGSPLPLLPDDVLAQGKEARALRQSPQTAREIRELRRLHTTLKDAIAAGMGVLHAHGLPADDLLVTMARGE